MNLGNRSKIFGLIAAILCIAISLVYVPAGMEPGLFKTILLICAFMIVLVSQALPVMLLSLLSIGIMPLIGVTDSFANSFGGFSNQAVYFVMMSFGLAAILMETPLCKRILRWTFQKIGRNVEGLILAIMICAALTSAFISDVPTCVLYLAFGEMLLQVYTEEEARKHSGKAVMLAVSFASMIGGIATPVGSTVNILASSILESTTGVTIGFLQWMAICVPVVVIMIPLTWKLLMKLYKPVAISEKDRIAFIQSFAQEKSFSMKEKKTIVIFLIMLILWFASSWISGISAMQVMFLGVCVFVIPGIGVTTIDKVIKSVKFDIILLVATILTLCSALMNQGFGEFMAELVPTLNMPVIGFFAAIVVGIYILILIVPIAPSLTTVVTPIVIALAVRAGINPAAVVPICSISIGCGYLLPMDSVLLMTYAKKYYTIKDFTKVSAVVMLAALLLAVTVAYGIMHLSGMIR